MQQVFVLEITAKCRITDKDILMSEEFMDSLAKLPDNDIYYFLTTITNMALCRQKQDRLFIQTVVLQLFQVNRIY